MEIILLSWSGGKDSALALNELLRGETYQVTALVTTVTESYDRISMHGVRRILLERQASSLGIPLEMVLISAKSSNEEYEQKMTRVLQKHLARGIKKVAFGDIFLEDLRKYREQNLASLGMEALFPLWRRDTNELSHSLSSLGFKAITTCVDTEALDQRFAGREINDDFLSELPDTVDLCGENGEYHSFVYDGPIFRSRIRFKIGEKVLREQRFYYCDLTPE